MMTNEKEIKDIASKALIASLPVNIATLNPTSALVNFKRQLLLGRLIGTMPIFRGSEWAHRSVEEATEKLLLSSKKKNNTSELEEVLCQLEKFNTSQKRHQQFRTLGSLALDVLETAYVITKEESNSLAQINILLSGGYCLFSANQIRMNLLVRKIQRLERLRKELTDALEA